MEKRTSEAATAENCVTRDGSAAGRRGLGVLFWVFGRRRTVKKVLGFQVLRFAYLGWAGFGFNLLVWVNHGLVGWI